MMISEEYLLPQEKILLKTQRTILSFNEFWISILLLILLIVTYQLNFYFSLFLLTIFVLFCLRILDLIISITYYITDQRVIIEKGVLEKEVEWILFQKIENVEFRKGILGSIFDFGDIRLRVSTEAEPELIIKNIKDPEKFQRFIITILTSLKVKEQT
jgi:uncharacterized membrane protein YdbT with pleckstrin-like domain